MIHLIRFFSIRHALTNRTRTFLTISGVALGVALVIAIQTVNHSILESIRKMFDSIAGRATLQLSSGATGVPEELWERLEKLPNVKYVTPVVQQVVHIPDMNNESVLLLGIDFTGDEDFRDYQYTDNEGENKIDDPLAFLNDPNAVLISETFSKKYHRNIGDQFILRVPAGNQKVRIRGILKADGPAKAFGGNFMVMDIFAAQALFEREGKFDRYDIITAPKKPVRDVMEEIRKALNNQFIVEVPRARGDSAQTLLVSFQTGLNMGGLVALLVALFLIYNTMQISVTQRRREISISKAIGAKKNDIVLLFMLESLLIGSVSSFLGIVLGLWMAKGMLLSVSSAISMHFLKVNPDTIDVSWKIMFAGFFSGVGASLLAAFGPARTASNISPIEGLRFETRLASFKPTWFTINAKISYLLFFLSGVCLYSTKILNGVYPGYISQLLTILAFAFLAPTLLVSVWKGLKWIPQKFFAPPERLAFDQLPRQATRAAVTLSAIMLGFGMVVEIDNYLFTLKNTLTRWVNQSIPADIFVTSGAKLARMDNRPLPENLEAKFKSWPEIEALDKVRSVEVEVEGVSVPLFALTPSIYFPHVQRDFIEGDRKEVMKRLETESGAVVSDNFLTRFHKKMGDEVPVHSPKGIHTFKIIGVVEDYTSDRGAIMLSRTQFIKAFDDRLVDSFDLYLKDKSKAGLVRQRILDSFSSDLELFALTNQEMKLEIYRIVDETYKIIKVLEMIAVLVSILGIVNTILASVLERTRMLGVLRALGATRSQIARMIMAEGGYIALGGMILGTVLGFALIKILFIGIIPHAIGWTFKLQVPYIRILCVAGVGLFLSIIVSYLPARRASNLNVVKAIEYE